MNIKIKSKKGRKKGKNMCASKCVQFMQKVLESNMGRVRRGIKFTDGKNEASKSTGQIHQPAKPQVKVVPHTPSKTPPPTQIVSVSNSTPYH